MGEVSEVEKPGEALKRVYVSSRNFMTPIIIETGWILEGEIAYELSRGKFMDRELFGISIVEKGEVGWEKKFDKSEAVSHEDYDAAEEAARNILRSMKEKAMDGQF